MLTASDFRYIYSHNTLPKGKRILTSEEIQKSTGANNSISREWISIETRIYSLAKSLLENKNPKNVPKEFNLWIEHIENFKKLSKYGFKLEDIGTHRFDYNYRVYF